MIIDVMTGIFIANIGGNGAADSVKNKFTVNNAVNEVPIINAAVTDWNFVFQVNPLFCRIQAQDAITVLSFGVMVPYHFVWSQLPVLSFYYWAKNGASIQSDKFPEINAPSGFLPAPFANYEMSLGGYCPWPVPSTGGPYADYELIASFLGGRVSMIGVPAALNGVVITPVPFVKIQHTLPLLVA